MSDASDRDDYLWDGAGEPDPEIRRLEEALGPLRYAGPPPELPARRAPAGRLLLGIAAAAALLLAVGGAVVGVLRPAAPAGEGWRVTRADGGEAAPLRPGGWLETGADGAARLEVPGLGRVDLGPETRVRLVASRDEERRLALAEGRLTAHIAAPPRLFVVETPAATAVDLGCAYVLDVDRDGRGWLEVTAGWVALERAERASLVPRGARCRIRPGQGPGTPAFADAPPALAEALRAFDAGEAAALEPLLAAARPRDTLTLWHLLEQTAGPARAAVLGRIEGLGPELPRDLDRSALLAGERAALDRLRRTLYPSWYHG